MIRIRTTLIMLLIAAGFVTAAVVYHGLSPREARATQNERRPLLEPSELPIDQISRITLQRRDEPQLVFERGPQGWRQIEPITFAVDPFSMRRMIADALELIVTRTIIPGKDVAADEASIASLGLDPPFASVRYEGGGRDVTVELGQRGVAGRAYARVVGKLAIYVVGQTLHDRAVTMDPKEWRDRTLFPNAGVESNAITRIAGKERSVLRREGKEWMLTEPKRTRVDSGMRDEYLQALGKARIGGFIEDQPTDLGRFGLENPVATLELRAMQRAGLGADAVESEHVRTLRIGGRVGGGSLDHYAMVEGVPVVFRIDQPTLAALFVDGAMLVDPTGSGENPADVKRIRIAKEGFELVLDRELERWIAPQHNNAEVPSAYVNDLLRKLTEVRADSITFADTYPRELESAVITLVGYTQRPLDTIRVLRDPETGLMALENGDNVLRFFSKELELRLTPEAFGLAGGVLGPAPEAVDARP